jgi:tripartite-type tricarboxylate transporter receptor subunit TctC
MKALNQFNRLRRYGLSLATLAALGGLAMSSHAQSARWPDKPVRLVVGYPAGGATDAIARLVASRLAEPLGQAVTVDNRPGANSNLGAEYVARAPADGTTLLVYSVAQTINASLYPKLGYDAQKDFVPIGLIAKIPNILVVNANSPVKTVADYVRVAKATPGGVTFASAGSGSSTHLSAEIFKMNAGVNLLHVPYRGSSPAITDLIGGQVQSMFDNAPSALPHIKSGRLRAVAITSARRSPLMPDLPTVAESGFPGFEVHSWFGLAAPAGTPQATVERLNAELGKVLGSAEVQQRLQDLAATPEAGTPEQMQALIATELKRWAAVVKSSGAQPN